MVSKALSALMEWAEDKQADASGSLPVPDNSEPAEINPAALIKELDFLGCEIVLNDGTPVIRGNKAAITPDLLDLLKAGREQIIKHLTAQASQGHEQEATSEPPQPESLPARHCEQSGIRRAPETGKLHIFGDPDPRWLKEQGWEWNEQRRRFMAPYPHDKGNPHPRFFVSARPAKKDNRMTGSGPCSVCGFTLWWRRAGDTSEGWTCSVCHPAPPDTATITPQTMDGLAATA
ncbi:hypothetical protein AA0313_2606 [Acetobacter indonesiensis NRIC 0313]|uniref:hypothetical protein n=1 Tax=Acetobacter indonesiensis TaxID=104101 RepID=UPI002156C1B2|nr:hypothetical protein [Acetobacter indonesiensis]GBQ61120.1 hypothetical protein AA0313_2606 [Acetobacter indonesiensis NRIC 0313]